MNQHRKQGQLDALQGKPRYYGAHIGMRSTLEESREEYHQGWDEVNHYLTKGDTTSKAQPVANEPTDRVNLLTKRAAKANAEGPKLTTYSIYYMRPEFFRDGSMGSEWLAERKRMPDAGDLLRTHIYLKEIEAASLDQAYDLMQGENWSPNGEARPLIEARGLQHTSMSMGDVLVDQHTFEAYMVDRFGFHQLTRFELPACGPSAD